MNNESVIAMKPHIVLRSREPLLYKCSECRMTFEPKSSAFALAEKFHRHLSAHGTSADPSQGNLETEGGLKCHCAPETKHEKIVFARRESKSA